DGSLGRVHRFARAESGRGARVNLSGAIKIEAHRELRAAPRLHIGHGTERDHFVVGIANVKQTDILGLGPELAFGLNENLPLPAETIEVVDEVTAHESLQRLADLGEIDALLHDV